MAVEPSETIELRLAAAAIPVQHSTNGMCPRCFSRLVTERDETQCLTCGYVQYIDGEMFKSRTRRPGPWWNASAALAGRQRQNVQVHDSPQWSQVVIQCPRDKMHMTISRRGIKRDGRVLTRRLSEEAFGGHSYRFNCYAGHNVWLWRTNWGLRWEY